jgi:hypothetical protein
VSERERKSVREREREREREERGREREKKIIMKYKIFKKLNKVFFVYISNS